MHKDSIDFSKAWFQSRYDKGDGADYVNCPLTGTEYRAFLDALLSAETTAFKDWEKDIALLRRLPADRGDGRARTRYLVRYGPMKPVGLTNPHAAERAHAVVQLRQDNALGTLYNIVGFQTKLKYGEQKRVFSLIPGLENAEFARLGGVHRNTFLNSPRLLDEALRLKARPRLRFAGQITGVEGYVESAAIGLLAGRFAAADHNGFAPQSPPADDRARCAPSPHYGWRRRGHFPADEHQFRAVPTARDEAQTQRPQGRRDAPGARRA